MTKDLYKTSGTIEIAGYRTELYGVHDDVLYYHFTNHDKNPYFDHQAAAQYAKWARGLHGNAPSGIFYRSFRVKLPNGQRVTLREYT
jgi:hypothetical protein